MPKINMNTQKPHKNRIVREHEIERALEEMYVSSEDEISEEEEVSGTLCYPPYDINRALDSLQNVMDAELLEVLAGNSSHTLRPTSPAITVEALSSEVIYQPWQPVATLPFTTPAVVVETLSSAVIHEPSYPADALQITPPVAKKPRLSAHQPSPLAAAHKPSSSVATQPTKTPKVENNVQDLPSTVVCSTLL